MKKGYVSSWYLGVNRRHNSPQWQSELEDDGRKAILVHTGESRVHPRHDGDVCRSTMVKILNPGGDRSPRIILVEIVELLPKMVPAPPVAPAQASDPVSNPIPIDRSHRMRSGARGFGRGAA